jgi:cell division protein FtsB
MKWLITVLIVLLVGLQYRLWISEGSFSHRAALQQKIDKQRAENTRLRERNAVLAIEVEELKSGLDAIEERAREQMGMIKQGETFFMIVDPKKTEANE